MKKYIDKFRDIVYYDKKEDEWHEGYHCKDVEEALSDIDNELFRVATLCDLGLCDEALEKIEEIRERL